MIVKNLGLMCLLIVNLFDIPVGRERKWMTSTLKRKAFMSFASSISILFMITNENSTGLFLEYLASGSHVTHGYMSDEGIWYLPGTGHVLLTFTFKNVIARSLIELIKIGTTNPSRLPSHVRISCQKRRQGRLSTR